MWKIVILVVTCLVAAAIADANEDDAATAAVAADADAATDADADAATASVAATNDAAVETEAATAAANDPDVEFIDGVPSDHYIFDYCAKYDYWFLSCPGKMPDYDPDKYAEAVGVLVDNECLLEWTFNMKCTDVRRILKAEYKAYVERENCGRCHLTYPDDISYSYTGDTFYFYDYDVDMEYDLTFGYIQGETTCQVVGKSGSGATMALGATKYCYLRDLVDRSGLSSSNGFTEKAGIGCSIDTASTRCPVVLSGLPKLDDLDVGYTDQSDVDEVEFSWPELENDTETSHRLQNIVDVDP